MNANRLYYPTYHNGAEQNREMELVLGEDVASEFYHKAPGSRFHPLCKNPRLEFHKWKMECEMGRTRRELRIELELSQSWIVVEL